MRLRTRLVGTPPLREPHLIHAPQFGQQRRRRRAGRGAGRWSPRHAAGGGRRGVVPAARRQSQASGLGACVALQARPKARVHQRHPQLCQRGRQPVPGRRKAERLRAGRVREASWGGPSGGCARYMARLHPAAGHELLRRSVGGWRTRSRSEGVGADAAAAAAASSFSSSTASAAAGAAATAPGLPEGGAGGGSGGGSASSASRSRTGSSAPRPLLGPSTGSSGQCCSGSRASPSLAIWGRVRAQRRHSEHPCDLWPHCTSLSSSTHVARLLQTAAPQQRHRPGP
jgi:hypothetical protein